MLVYTSEPKLSLMCASNEVKMCPISHLRNDGRSGGKRTAANTCISEMHSRKCLAIHKGNLGLAKN